MVAVVVPVRLRFALLAVLLAAVPARALTVRALSLDELAARAHRVVHARCVAVAPAPPAGGVPAVEIVFAVDETFKGPAAERLVVRQVGGRFARMLPPPRPGDEVVLFLHAPSRIGLTSPVGLGQGVLRVVRPAGEAPRLAGDARIVGALVPGPVTAAATGGPVGAGATAPLDAALAALRARVGAVP